MSKLSLESSPLVEKLSGRTAARQGRGLAVRSASLTLLAVLVVLAYRALSTPLEWTELDPVYDLDTPLRSAGIARTYGPPILYTYEDPVMHIAGTIRPGADNRMPAGADPDMTIVLQVDGGAPYQKRVPYAAGPYAFDMDLSGVADGKHTVRIFEEGVIGWRTWRTRALEFDIDYMAGPIQPPVIVWLHKVKEPDVFEIVGMVRAREQAIIRGADLVERPLFVPGPAPVPTQAPVKGQTVKPEFVTVNSYAPAGASIGYFSDWLRPRPGETITIDSRVESLGRESNAPIVIQPGKLEEFAAGLKGLMRSRVSLNFSTRGISSDVTTTVPSDNVLFEQLMGGQTQMADFLDSAVGGISVNNSSISGAYSDVLPQVQAANGIATLEARGSGDWLIPLRPLGDSTVLIRYLPGLWVRRLDELQLALGDYKLLSATPAASSIVDDTYTWKDLQPGTEIRLRVGRDSLAQVLSISNWSIFDFVGGHYWIAYGITFLLDLVIASVLFWLMWLNSRVEPQDALGRKLHALLLGAGVIFLVPSLYNPLLYLANLASFNPFVARRMEALQGMLEPLLPSIAFPAPEMLARLILLAAVLLVIRYLAWLLGRDSPFTRQLLKVIFRLGLTLLVIELGMMLLAAVFQPLADAPGAFYIRWTLEAFLLSALGLQVLHVAMDLVQARRPGQAQVRTQHLTELLTLLVILPLAFVLTARSPERFPVGLEYPNIQNGVRDGLAALRGGAIYYSAIGAMMLAVRLQGAGGWKWDGGQEQRARSTDGVLRMQRAGWSERERQWIWLGTIMFAAYLAGVGNTILWIPVSAILGVVVFPRLLNSPERLGQLAFYADRVFAQRRALLGQLADELALNRLRTRLQQLLVSLSGGKMTPSEYDQSVAIVQGEMNHIDEHRTVKDISADEYVLAYGPEKRPLDNAFLGAKWALFLQVPLLIALFRPGVLDREQYRGLYLSVAAFVFVMRWVLTGFFFGLYYEYLQGNNGIRKALTVTIGLLLCTLPYRILRAAPSPEALPAVVLEAGLTAVFLVALGALFDGETLRRQRFGISYLRVVMNDFTSLAYVSSALVPVLTVLIPALVTGQLAQILTAIVQGVLPVITAAPGITTKVP